MPAPLPLKPAKPAIFILLAGLVLGYGFGKGFAFAKPRPAENAAKQPLLAEAGPVSPERAAQLFQSGEPHQLKAFLSSSTDREALLWLRLRWGEFTSDDYAAAATDVIALGIGRHQNLFGELMEAWGQAAPTEAIAFVEKQPEALKKPAFEAIIRGWSEADPDALLAWYQAKKDDYAFRKLRATVAGALAKARPEAAFQLLEGDEGGQDRESAHAFFSNLAKTSPQQALQFLGRLSSSEQEENLQPLLMGWTMVDPDGAAAWVSSLPKGGLRQKGFQMLVGSLSLSAPREAAELAMKELTDPRLARFAAITVAQMWASAEPEEAERFFAGQPDTPFKKEALRMIEAQWASLHPLDYLNDAVGKGDFSQESFVALNTAFATLAQQDEGELRRWLGENRHDVPPDLLARMISSSVFTNPKGAAELLVLLPEGAQADSTYGIVAMNWARQDMEGARQFLATLPEGAARNRFQAALLGRLSETNLPEALREIEGVTDSAMQTDLLTSIARQTKAPEKFAHWLLSQPPDKTNASLYSEVTQRWFRTDPAATAAWIGTLPEGSARQNSIRTYAVEITGSDPKAAIEWAQRLDNEKSREATLTRIADQWARADKAAAAAWIKESALPDKVKKRYLKD